MSRLPLAPFLALMITVGALGGAAQADSHVTKYDKPVALPAFSLTDHTGKPFTADSFKGHWSLAAIGYTMCPDVCPFILNNLAAVEAQVKKRLGAAHLPQVVFVSVDPKRDKAGLGQYVSSFGPEFLGATGARAEIDKFVKGIGGFYHLGHADKDGNYNVAHSAFVIVVGPDGRIRGKMMPPLKPASIADDLARMQTTYAKRAQN